MEKVNQVDEAHYQPVTRRDIRYKLSQRDGEHSTSSGKEFRLLSLPHGSCTQAIAAAQAGISEVKLEVSDFTALEKIDYLHQASETQLRVAICLHKDIYFN